MLERKPCLHLLCHNSASAGLAKSACRAAGPLKLCGLVLSFRKLRDVSNRVLQGDKLPTARQRYRIQRARLGGVQVRKSNGQRVVIGRLAQKAGAAANHKRAANRAADLAPTIEAIREGGAVTFL
jgi:hypothetical protein